MPGREASQNRAPRRLLLHAITVIPMHVRNTQLHQRFSPLFETRFEVSDTAPGAISGYASVYGVVDSYGTVFKRGAFRRTLEEHRAEQSAPALLWCHDARAPIGSWSTIREDDRGLFVQGRLNLEVEKAREALALIKAGDVNGLSVGFMVDPDNISATGNGALELSDVDLVEVSIVPAPANRRARLQLDSRRDLEGLLHRSGLPRAAAQRIAAGGWPALIGGNDESASIRNAAAQILDAANKLKG